MPRPESIKMCCFDTLSITICHHANIQEFNNTDLVLILDIHWNIKWKPKRQGPFGAVINKQRKLGLCQEYSGICEWYTFIATDSAIMVYLWCLSANAKWGREQMLWQDQMCHIICYFSKHLYWQRRSYHGNKRAMWYQSWRTKLFNK